MGKADLKVPITAEELMETKKNCRVGDKIRVFNDWRINPKRNFEKYGR